MENHITLVTYKNLEVSCGIASDTISMLWAAPVANVQSCFVLLLLQLKTCHSFSLFGGPALGKCLPNGNFGGVCFMCFFFFLIDN